MITYEVVTLADVADLAMTSNHWDEAGRKAIDQPFDLDIETYQAVEAIGKLSIVAAFAESGMVIGYCVDILGRHPHCDMPAAINSALYVKKKYRKQGVPDALVLFAQAHLKTLGMNLHILAIPANTKYSLVSRLEYQHLETSYFKEL